MFGSTQVGAGPAPSHYVQKTDGQGNDEYQQPQKGHYGPRPQLDQLVQAALNPYQQVWICRLAVVC